MVFCKIPMLKVACIPAFNEEHIIFNVISECKEYVDKVIVCDDGSNDSTYELAKKAGAVVLRHDKNLGKGAALKSLFTYCRKINADIIVTIDGDGQFLSKEINDLMQPILNENSDIVIGNRFSYNHEMPSYRKVGNKILDKITNLAAELPFEDTQSGFRAYSRKALESITFSVSGFGVDAEILIDASRKNLKISEVPVYVIYNTGGKTSTKNPISHTTSVVTSLIELIAIRRPLTYIGIPGLILIILGSIFTVVVISLFNETRYFSIPYTLLSIGSLLIGVLFALMSVVLYSIGKASNRNI